MDGFPAHWPAIREDPIARQKNRLYHNLYNIFQEA